MCDLNHTSATGPKTPPIGGGLRNTQPNCRGLRKNLGLRHQKMALKMVILKQKLDFFRLQRLSASQEVLLSKSQSIF